VEDFFGMPLLEEDAPTPSDSSDLVAQDQSAPHLCRQFGLPLGLRHHLDTNLQDKQHTCLSVCSPTYSWDGCAQACGKCTSVPMSLAARMDATDVSEAAKHSAQLLEVLTRLQHPAGSIDDDIPK
jgi:hypothetical protein